MVRARRIGEAQAEILAAIIAQGGVASIERPGASIRALVDRGLLTHAEGQYKITQAGRMAMLQFSRPA